MEFSQFYFGSLLSNSNTFLLAWPQVHFEATFGLPMTPRRTVTEAVGSEKLVDGPAFTVDFMAGPSGSAGPPSRPSVHPARAVAAVVSASRARQKQPRVFFRLPQVQI